MKRSVSIWLHHACLMTGLASAYVLVYEICYTYNPSHILLFSDGGERDVCPEKPVLPAGERG